MVKVMYLNYILYIIYGWSWMCLINLIRTIGFLHSFTISIEYWRAMSSFETYPMWSIPASNQPMALRPACNVVNCKISRPIRSWAVATHPPHKSSWTTYPTDTSWWFQPLWRMSQIGSNWIISPNRGENKTIWNHHLGYSRNSTGGSGWFFLRIIDAAKMIPTNHTRKWWMPTAKPCIFEAPKFQNLETYPNDPNSAEGTMILGDLQCQSGPNSVSYQHVSLTISQSHQIPTTLQKYCRVTTPQ